MKMFNRNSKFILLLILSIFLSHCSTQKINSIEGIVKPVSESEYTKLIEASTKKDEKFNALNNTYKVYATQLTREVALMSLQKKAHFLQWNEEQFRKERLITLSEQDNKTQFFMSFYTPEKRENSLQLSDSLWKIFLEVDGQRYPSEIRLNKEKFIQLKELFPFHSRWSQAYKVSFPLSLGEMENRAAKLIITSPLGMTELNFE